MSLITGTNPLGQTWTLGGQSPDGGSGSCEGGVWLTQGDLCNGMHGGAYAPECCEPGTVCQLGWGSAPTCMPLGGSNCGSNEQCADGSLCGIGGVCNPSPDGWPCDGQGQSFCDSETCCSHTCVAGPSCQ